MEKNKYYILMGDIVSSRTLDYKKLWSSLNCLEKNISDNFVLEYFFQIKNGDEFQLISKNLNQLLNIMYYINIYLSHNNINVRFVLGYGKIEFGLENYKYKNLIGSGLSYTHDLLNEKVINKYAFFIQDDISKNLILNQLGFLLYELEKSITQKQYTYLYYKVIEKLENVDIAKKMNLTLRSIYGLEERSKYSLFKDTFDIIERSLKY